MTTHSEYGRTAADVQNRVRLTGDDATLVVETWHWQRISIRVDQLVEMVRVHSDDQGTAVRYTVRAYGPVQTAKSKRDHATRRSDITWTDRDKVPMALLRHLQGEAALRERLSGLLGATAKEV